MEFLYRKGASPGGLGMEIRAEVKRIPWGLEDGYTSVCAKVPQSKIPLSGTETIELYPYGCAKLRMTELPLL